jgi:hypothetical protein
MIGTFFLLFLFLFSYIFLAATLILEHVTPLLSSGRSWDSALLQAQLQYIQLALTSSAIQFPAGFQEYSDAEFIQFILKNRLLTK